MHRREFNASILKLSVAALVAPRLLAGPRASAAASEITDLYKSAIVIDSLCGPFLDDQAMPTPEQVAVIRPSGITAVNCTISGRNLDDTIKTLAALDAMVEEYPEAFAMVRGEKHPNQ